ncbi:MAG: gamma carbonic anhydrase family protein [Pseudomonadota bacterium]|nr:gamma carbonic anhydrase family protein [Pseudomonadota bacterium]
MIYTLGDLQPEIHPNAFVAPGAVVIGAVLLREESSVWFGSVLRGDTDTLIVGRRSNIQDRCVLHTDPGLQLVVGENVTVGHGVILHGCRIGNGSLVGIGSTILNGAEIGESCLVGANTLITEGKSYPDRSLILGSPGRVVRSLTDGEAARLEASAGRYVENAGRYRRQLAEKH